MVYVVRDSLSVIAQRGGERERGRERQFKGLACYSHAKMGDGCTSLRGVGYVKVYWYWRVAEHVVHKYLYKVSSVRNGQESCIACYLIVDVFHKMSEMI